MFYYNNLLQQFFDLAPRNATHFYALSGFVGPNPIERLNELPFSSTVVYGLHKENKNKGTALHKKLIDIHSDKIKILYPDIACHSKCYVWLEENKPIRGLVGSANFTSNGLENDYRESLIEVAKNELYIVKGYIDIIVASSKSCTDVNQQDESLESKGSTYVVKNKEICEMILFEPRTGEVPSRSGLNWGLAEGSNVNPEDAYIPIRVDHIKNYLFLFPPIRPKLSSERVRGNPVDVIEIIWDDGVSMKGRLEGSQPIDGVKHPKQISSSPTKSELGAYFRRRLGLSPGQQVKRSHLESYGASSVRISLLSDGVYYFDFSPTN